VFLAFCWNAEAALGFAGAQPSATQATRCSSYRNRAMIRLGASRSAPCTSAKGLKFKAVAVMACDDEVLRPASNSRPMRFN
jgi:hypothetical protein